MNKLVLIIAPLLLLGTETIGQVVRRTLEECEPQYTTFEKDGRYGVKKTETGEIVSRAEYTAIDLCVAFDAKFGIAKKNGKWAVIEKNGKPTSRFRYEQIQPIPEDFDQTYLMASSESGKWTLIGSTGQAVSKRQYDEIIRPDRALFEVRREDLWGVIDTAGTEVIPLKYDKVSFLAFSAYAVEKNGKQGVVFIGDGNDIPIAYETISGVKSGLCAYKDGQCYLFNSRGEALGIDDLEEVRYYGNIFYDDEILVKKHGKYGLIRINEGWIVPALYDSIHNYLDYHIVTLDSLYGIYRKDGDLIFPPKYNHFRRSNQDFIVKQEDKMGVIGGSGNEILPVIYDQVLRLVNRRTHGLDYTYGVLLDSVWRLVYPNGQIVDSLRFDHLQQFDNKIILATKGDKKYLGEFDGKRFKFYYNFPLNDFGSVTMSNGTYLFKKDGKLGVINIQRSDGDLPGSIIRQPEFDDIYYADGNQYLITVKNGKLGLMNRQAQDILPCNYGEVDSFGLEGVSTNHYLIIRNDQEELKVSYYGQISRIDKKRE